MLCITHAHHLTSKYSILRDILTMSFSSNSPGCRVIGMTHYRVPLTVLSTLVLRKHSRSNNSVKQQSNPLRAIPRHKSCDITYFRAWRIAFAPSTGDKASFASAKELSVDFVQHGIVTLELAGEEGVAPDHPGKVIRGEVVRVLLGRPVPGDVVEVMVSDGASKLR